MDGLSLHEEILISRILVYSSSCGYDQLTPWTHELFVQYTDEGEVAHVFGMAKNQTLENIPDLKISEMRKILRMIARHGVLGIRWRRPGGKVTTIDPLNKDIRVQRG